MLADLPRAVAPTAQLQILRDGFDPVLVPFTDTDPGFDRTFSAWNQSSMSKVPRNVGVAPAVLGSCIVGSIAWQRSRARRRCVRSGGL